MSLAGWAPARETGAISLLGHRRFRAMNTDVQIFLSNLDFSSLLANAEDIFHHLESRLSRFLASSELTLLNRRSHPTVAVSQEMLEVLEAAVRLHTATNGLFDPSILPDLEAVGYDRSFPEVNPSLPEPCPPLPPRTASFAQLEIDRRQRMVTVPPGLRIDLGGIGKGYAVDAAARLLQPAGDYLVGAGGDIFAAGHGPGGDGWVVGIANPLSGSDAGLVRLRNAALATSTTALRRWRRAGRLCHHLIDPRTRRPAQTPVLSATVAAPSAVEADVYAKVALLLGPARGARFLESNSCPGLFVLNDGSCVQTRGWGLMAELLHP